MSDLSWLRDAKNPCVISCLKYENEYAEKNLRFEADIYASLLEGILETDVSVPVISESGEWTYYVRTDKDKPYPRHCRIATSETDEFTVKKLYEYISKPTHVPNVYFDENDIKEEYKDIGCISNSPDNSMFAVAIDYVGNESYVINVYDFEGNFIDKIENVTSWFAWASNKSIFYMTSNEQSRIDSLWLWNLEENHHSCIYVEKDEYFNIDITTSADGKYIFVLSSSLTKSEVWVASTKNPTSLVCIYPRSSSILTIEHYYGYFIWSNNSQLMCGTSAHDSRILMPKTDLFIQDISVRNNHICLLGYKNGNTYVCVASIELADITDISWKPDFKQIILPDICKVSILDSLWKDKELYITYSTPTQPETTIGIDPYTLEHVTIKHETTRYDVSKYICERQYAKGHDGVKIPITIIRLKTIELPAPAIQYGYGAYGVSVETGFDPDVLCLCDKGIIWVVAHVRGGSEMGS